MGFTVCIRCFYIVICVAYICFWMCVCVFVYQIFNNFLHISSLRIQRHSKRQVLVNNGGGADGSTCSSCVDREHGMRSGGGGGFCVSLNACVSVVVTFRAQLTNINGRCVYNMWFMYIAISLRGLLAERVDGLCLKLCASASTSAATGCAQRDATRCVCHQVAAAPNAVINAQPLGRAPCGARACALNWTVSCRAHRLKAHARALLPHVSDLFYAACFSSFFKMSMHACARVRVRVFCACTHAAHMHLVIWETTERVIAECVCVCDFAHDGGVGGVANWM